MSILQQTYVGYLKEGSDTISLVWPRSLLLGGGVWSEANYAGAVDDFKS